MRGVLRWGPRLIVALGGLLVWTVALLLTDGFVEGVMAPEDACYQEAVPLFESTEVERARVSGWPPVIRCTLVDPRYPTEAQGLWGWPEVVILAVVDLAAVALVVAVLRRWRGRIDRARRATE